MVAEINLFNDVMLMILFFSLGSLIFSSAVLASLPASSPPLIQLNSTLQSIRSAANGVSYSFNVTLVQAHSSDLLYPIEIFINGLWKGISVVYALLVLFFVSIAAFLTIIFIVLPAVFPATILGAGLGSFIGGILVIAFATLSIYIIYLTLLMLGIRKHPG